MIAAMHLLPLIAVLSTMEPPITAVTTAPIDAAVVQLSARDLADSLKTSDGRGWLLPTHELGQAIAASGALRVPARWFNDRPLAVSLHTPQWPCDYRIVATPRFAGGQPASAEQRCNLCGGDAQEWMLESFQQVGTPPANSSSVTFDVRVSSGFGHELWSGAISFPLILIDPVEPTADDSAEFTALVMAHYTSRVRATYGDGASWPKSISIHCSADWNPHLPLGDYLVSGRVELLHRGKMIDSFPIWWHDGTAFVGGSTLWFAELAAKPRTPPEDLARLIADPINDGDFSIQVCGQKPAHANHWCETRYWSGQFTLPLAGHIERVDRFGQPVSAPAVSPLSSNR